MIQILLLLTLSATQAHAGFDPQIEALADKTAGALKQQMDSLLAPLAHPAPVGCTDPAATVTYEQALAAKGDFAGCVALARQCLPLKRDGHVGGALFAGGACAEALYQFADAYKFYDAATSPARLATQADDVEGKVLLFARFAQFTDFASRTLSILQRNPEWSAPEAARKISDVLLYLNTGDPGARAVSELDSWIAERIDHGGPVLKPFLVNAWLSHLLRQKYDYPGSLKFLDAHLDDLRNPQAWFTIAYQTFYDQDLANSPLARRIYQAYLPYAHARAQLPTELNSYRYSELYADVCKANLLSTGSPELKALKELRMSWAAGTTSSESALAQAQAMLSAHPQAADVQALVAGIQDHLGQEDAAFASFWRAHELCPYFDRAHWGLERILYRQRTHAFSDYAASLARIDRELQGITFAPELSQYVINWAFLSPEAQKRLKYAIRYWAPFIVPLYRSGARLYVKAGVQYLSDVPGNEELKDTRIEYDHDNRLWDDVRGVGGKIVAVDYDQMMEGAFGDYNLAGHEITHQFQGHAAADGQFPQEQFNCSVALYNAAAARGVFADPYAGRNFLEYLAQGVAYYMIPEDAPARFGLNSAWVREHDPDLYDFLGQIQLHHDDLSRIRCRVSPAAGATPLDVSPWDTSSVVPF